MCMNNKIIKLGYYIKPNRHNAMKGVVYSALGIAPCVMDYSGGGNLVPTILVLSYEASAFENR